MRSKSVFQGAALLILLIIAIETGCSNPISAPASPTTGLTSTATNTPSTALQTATCVPPVLGGSYTVNITDTRVVAPGVNPGCSSAVTYQVAGDQINMFGNLAATANGNTSYAGADWHYYNFGIDTSAGENYTIEFGCFGSNQYSMILNPCTAPVTYTGPATIYGNGFSYINEEIAVVGLSGTPGPYTVSVWELGTATATFTPTPTPTP